MLARIPAYNGYINRGNANCAIIKAIVRVLILASFHIIKAGYENLFYLNQIEKMRAWLSALNPFSYSISMSLGDDSSHSDTDNVINRSSAWSSFLFFLYAVLLDLFVQIILNVHLKHHSSNTSRRFRVLPDKVSPT